MHTLCRVEVYIHQEVIFEEEEAHNGEKINQDNGQHSSEEDGASVLCHTPHHIQQSLLSAYQIKQLERHREKASIRVFNWEMEHIKFTHLDSC